MSLPYIHQLTDKSPKFGDQIYLMFPVQNLASVSFI